MSLWMVDSYVILETIVGRLLVPYTCMKILQSTGRQLLVQRLKSGNMDIFYFTKSLLFCGGFTVYNQLDWARLGWTEALFGTFLSACTSRLLTFSGW